METSNLWRRARLQVPVRLCDSAQALACVRRPQSDLDTARRCARTDRPERVLRLPWPNTAPVSSPLTASTCADACRGFRRPRPVPLHAAGAMVALTGITVVFEWVAVIARTPPVSSTVWAPVLVSGLVVDSVLTTATAVPFVRGRRGRGPAGPWRHDLARRRRLRLRTDSRIAAPGRSGRRGPGAPPGVDGVRRAEHAGRGGRHRRTGRRRTLDGPAAHRLHADRRGDVRHHLLRDQQRGRGIHRPAGAHPAPPYRRDVRRRRMRRDRCGDGVPRRAAADVRVGIADYRARFGRSHTRRGFRRLSGHGRVPARLLPVRLLRLAPPPLAFGDRTTVRERRDMHCSPRRARPPPAVAGETRCPRCPSQEEADEPGAGGGGAVRDGGASVSPTPAPLSRWRATTRAPSSPTRIV